MLSSGDTNARHYLPGCHLLQGNRQTNKCWGHVTTTAAAGGKNPGVQERQGGSAWVVREVSQRTQIYQGL